VLENDETKEKIAGIRAEKTNQCPTSTAEITLFTLAV
jgi:hypothetical protein